MISVAAVAVIVVALVKTAQIVYRGVMGRDAPEATFLAIRGDELKLGEQLTTLAATNLEQALAFLLGRVAELGQRPSAAR